MPWSHPARHSNSTDNVLLIMHYLITEPSTPIDTPTTITLEEPKPKPEKTREKPRAAAQPDRPARSLFFFTLKNPIRKLCYAIVEKK